jgi:gentisate 1,2-dioxygenase
MRSRPFWFSESEGKTFMKYVDSLDTLEYYEQDSGPNIEYQFVVKPGTMGLLSAGRVRLKGPTHKADDVHDSWDQVYLVLGGQGKVIVGTEAYPVQTGSVVRVPKGTLHGVVLDEGEALEYCYFNAFVDDEALQGLVANL